MPSLAKLVSSRGERGEGRGERRLAEHTSEASCRASQSLYPRAPPRRQRQRQRCPIRVFRQRAGGGGPRLRHPAGMAHEGWPARPSSVSEWPAREWPLSLQRPGGEAIAGARQDAPGRGAPSSSSSSSSSSPRHNVIPTPSRRHGMPPLVANWPSSLPRPPHSSLPQPPPPPPSTAHPSQSVG